MLGEEVLASRIFYADLRRASSSSLRGNARVQLWKVEAAGRLQPWAELGLVTATGE